MMTSRHFAIEFIGGPFDGHHLVMSLPASEELAPTAAFPIDRNVFDLLHGRIRRRKARVTSVAIYHLISSPGAVPHQYYFVTSVAPEDLPLPDPVQRR